MSEASYRFFDHTGDFGVELTAPGRAAAVAGVARAFLDLLTGAPDAVAERAERAVAVHGLTAADTLVAFGNELLYLFEGEGFLCARFVPEVVEDEVIEGVARGEPFDPDRHPIARPIKAVTYHTAELALDERAAPDEQVRARLIFDL